MTSLCVGIAGTQTGWDLLFVQEGIPHRRVVSMEDLEGCSAVVAGDGAAALVEPLLKPYLRRGGGLLCSGALLSQIAGGATSAKQIRYVRGDDASRLGPAGIVDLETPGRVPASSNALPGADGHPTAFIGEAGGGIVVALPFDPGTLTLDTRHRTKSYYSRRSRLPYENVPTVSKSGVREIVARSLKLLHHRRNLPYAHLWYYPDGEESLTIVRIDTDGSGRKELEEVAGVSASSRIPFSWYLDLRTQQRHLAWYGTLGGHEVGLHCYDHLRYPNAAVAREDLLRGKNLLLEQGIDPAGCVLPYGQWSSALGRVQADLGFHYSSEFAFDVDNFPSRPLLDGEDSPVLQIPVHPISIGSLRRQGFAPEEMIEYFERVIEEKRRASLPLAIYHHPLNGHADVLSQVLAIAGHAGHRSMTMGAFARWWTQRALCHPSISVDATTVRSKLDHTLTGATVRLVMPDGREAIVPAGTESRLERVTWGSPRGELETPGDLGKVRSFNPWIPLQRCEDALMRWVRPSRRPM